MNNLEGNLLLVQKKMQRIKENTLSIQDQITKMLEDHLQELHEIVQRKTSILKSDQHEINRQRQEILYVQSFFKIQSAEASPLEFLQLSVGYAHLKDQMLRQMLKISGDLQDDKDLLKISGKPLISYNDDQKNKTFDMTQIS